MKKKILVVDDERAIRNTLSEILEFEGYETILAEDGQDAVDKINENKADLSCILCDIKMPKLDGIEVLEKAKEIIPDIPFIIISGHGNVENAVEAVKKGAFDFISKPPDLNRLLITVRNAIDREFLTTETKKLKSTAKQQKVKNAIIGNSASLNKIFSIIEKVAPTDARVLITGENGTGKELIAQRIYEMSNRTNQPFIEVNCAAIPSELIESELFGHEKGSFTSAIKQRLGKFEQANGGTLFLDEIGDMSLSAQAKVLRALQEGKITRVGGEKEILVDVRVIAATNKTLQDEIKNGNFREDLYHRLSVILLTVPPLRERMEDIPALTNFFLERICSEYKIPIKNISSEAVNLLLNHSWTGNIRELHNIIERLIILSGKNIEVEDVKNYL